MHHGNFVSHNEQDQSKINCKKFLGSNRYCLDKNYAGVFIIWDRIFRTFEWERKGSKMSYGLVDQPQYLNPLKVVCEKNSLALSKFLISILQHQFSYYGNVVKKSNGMENIFDKISAFLKGPGWFPGTERLGDITFVPEVFTYYLHR